MASLHGQKTIVHFTHPNHTLFEINNDNEYRCDGCKTFGSGTRFRCHGCNFNLHQYCGICPMTLFSFMHPWHQLSLVNRTPQAIGQNARFCDVCGDFIEGLSYRCELCEFDVHPVCTLLPQQVRHVLDPAHPLTLQPFSSSLCVVCGNQCTSWRYRCGICGVDIHLECLLTPCDHASKSTSTSSTTPSQSVWQPRAPPAFGAHYGVPSFSYGANNYAHRYPAPSFVAYGTPYGPYNNMMPLQQQLGNQQKAAGCRGLFTRIMFGIVGNIALAVLTNAVIGI